MTPYETPSDRLVQMKLQELEAKIDANTKRLATINLMLANGIAELTNLLIDLRKQLGL